ncbi:hypothetical protein [Corallococcus silvisoli]|uniref:hypothetical protein n=1 Tax=Corallococcus silvisoli TaxID=2697031 RepID=UPI001F2CEB8B|nr:hypothetical protein [Corallococcus silvisoli]
MRRRLRRLGWAGLISLALHAIVLWLLGRMDPAPSSAARVARLRAKAIEVEILPPPPTPAAADAEPSRPPVQGPHAGVATQGPPKAPPPSDEAPRKPPKATPPGVATREPPRPPPATPPDEAPRKPPSAPPEVATREPPPAPDTGTRPDAPEAPPGMELRERADRPTDDAPRAQAPGTLPPNLLPPPGASGGVIISTPENSSGGGRTLRPGDPSLSAETLAAEEHARVSERVRGMVDDRRARDRVDTGRIHPYFSKLRATLEKQMDAPPLFDMPSLPKQLLYSFAEKARRFGATGSPGGNMPLSAAPTPGEKLADRGRDNPKYNSLRTRAQAGEELQDFAHGVSTLKLVVTLELLQGQDGILREVKLISRSGNRAYDDYVLQSVPPALEKIPAPPADALGVHTEGIRSVWAVEGRVVYIRKLRDMQGTDSAYLAAAAAAGVLAGGFEETTGDVYVIDVRNPHFECRSRLLRVY